ncbi:hypothetical protein D3C72_1409250 [compost metagenome]
MLSDLLIALTCVRRAELMEASEIVCMQDVPGRADDFLQNIQEAFAWRDQIAATGRRHLPCKTKCTSNMFVHRNPTRRRGTGATAFGAILNVDPA